MYKNKPKMAKKWEKETPKGTKLPKKSNVRLLKRGKRNDSIPYVIPAREGM